MTKATDLSWSDTKKLISESSDDNEAAEHAVNFILTSKESKFLRLARSKPDYQDEVEEQSKWLLKHFDKLSGDQAKTSVRFFIGFSEWLHSASGELLEEIKAIADAPAFPSLHVDALFAYSRAYLAHTLEQGRANPAWRGPLGLPTRHDGTGLEASMEETVQGHLAEIAASLKVCYELGLERRVSMSPVPFDFSPAEWQATIRLGELADAWQQLFVFVDQVRSFRGTLEFRGSTDPASDLDLNDKALNSVWEHTPEDPAEWAFHVSLTAWYLQIAWIEDQLQLIAPPPNKYAPKGPPCELSPTDFVSRDEWTTLKYLETRTGKSPQEVAVAPTELTLAEWVRGLFVLKQMCETQDKFVATTDPITPMIHLKTSGDEIIRALRHYGFQEERARTFLGEVAFTGHRGPRELMSHPVVAADPDCFLIFGASLMFSPLLATTLRTLTARNFAFDPTGKVLEKRVRSLLEKRDGLRVRTFSYKDGNKRREFDAVALFEDKLFIFECKSSSFSEFEPALAKSIGSKIDDMITQVKAQAESLERRRDIIEKHFPDAPSELEIVPCIVTEKPLFVPTAKGTVNFVDYASLWSFFEAQSWFISRPFYKDNLSRLSPSEKGVRHIERRPKRHILRKYWKDKEPTAEDLKLFVHLPPFYEVALKHMVRGKYMIGLLNGRALLYHGFRVRPSTDETIARALGADLKKLRSFKKDARRSEQRAFNRSKNKRPRKGKRL